MPKTIVFDVNETLLDLRALDAPFAKHFGNPAVRAQWFGQVLQTALVVTITGDYADFAAIGGAALGMVEQRHGITLGDDARKEILMTMRSLPAHPDAAPALEKLRDSGYRLVTLTNSPPVAVAAQLESSGLAKYFERQLSVDAVKTFKPAKQVYDMAARELGEAPGSLWLVAAHNWDTTGALSAGWKAAFISRPGMVLGSLDRRPQVAAPDLVQAAEKIIAADR